MRSLTRIFATILDISVIYSFIFIYTAIWGLLIPLDSLEFESVSSIISLVLLSVFALYIKYIYPFTIGRTLMNIELVSEDGEPIKLKQILIRLFIMFWPLEFFNIFNNPEKRLGDKIADTKIVFNKPQRGFVKNFSIMIVFLFTIHILSQKLMLYSSTKTESYRHISNNILNLEIESEQVKSFNWYPKKVFISTSYSHFILNAELENGERILLLLLAKREQGQWTFNIEKFEGDLGLFRVGLSL